MEIKNFVDVYSYVNERYVFNESNYPALGELSIQRQKIFEINHGILHMLKNQKLLPVCPGPRNSIDSFKWLSYPVDELASIGKGEKIALLKMFVNIVSLAHSIGITTDDLKYFEATCTDKKLMKWFQLNEIKPLLRPFNYYIQIFLERMVIILEKADHDGMLKTGIVFQNIENIYQAMYFWFGELPWLPKLLQDIPKVMKSK